MACRACLKVGVVIAILAMYLARWETRSTPCGEGVYVPDAIVLEPGWGSSMCRSPLEMRRDEVSRELIYAMVKAPVDEQHGGSKVRRVNL